MPARSPCVTRRTRRKLGKPGGRRCRMGSCEHQRFGKEPHEIPSSHRLRGRDHGRRAGRVRGPRRARQRRHRARPVRRRQPRRVRADRQHRRQPGGRLSPGSRGTLQLAGTYDTGGLGGQLTGSVVDHLASQGSLAYDPAHGLLYAVNAGSNTVSVFAAYGATLSPEAGHPLRRDVPGQRRRPRGPGICAERAEGRVGAGLPGWLRPPAGHPGLDTGADLTPTATPQFTNTPGQVAFSPDGLQLIVTTKANGNNIDVFGVQPSGTLSDNPVVNNEPSAVPFAITYDPAGNLVIAEAGPNALATFTLSQDGTVTQLDQVGTARRPPAGWPATKPPVRRQRRQRQRHGYRSTPSATSPCSARPTDPGTVDAVAARTARSSTCRPAGTASLTSTPFPTGT